MSQQRIKLPDCLVSFGKISENNKSHNWGGFFFVSVTLNSVTLLQ